MPSVHGGREGPPDIWTWECTHGAYITGGLGRALEESNITLPPPDHPLAHKFDGGPSGFRRVFLHPPIPMYYPVFAGTHQRRLIFSSSLTAPPPRRHVPAPPGVRKPYTHPVGTGGARTSAPTSPFAQGPSSRNRREWLRGRCRPGPGLSFRGQWERLRASPPKHKVFAGKGTLDH